MQKCITIFIIPYLYEAQHVSGNTPPVISSLKLHWQPLIFHMWKVVGCLVGGCCQAHCAWQCPPTRRPTFFHIWKIRDYQCSFRLLMMGSVSPETCWASYKYGMIKILIHFCILLDFSLWTVLWCMDPWTSNYHYVWRWGVICTAWLYENVFSLIPNILFVWMYLQHINLNLQIWNEFGLTNNSWHLPFQNIMCLQKWQTSRQTYWT
jgi:hypothetical protein